MNWSFIQKNWPSIRTTLKSRLPRLTDSDLDLVAGDRDALAESIHQRYGVSREDALGTADEWAKTVAPRAKPDQAELDQQRSESEGMGQGRYNPPLG